jgi:hypothetical protein
MSTRALRALDPIFGALAVVFGLGSITYPFGRDQGLYYYVAREWVLRGSVPYKDILDHKTPGIYYLYALGVRLFGEGMFGIRILDFVGVIGAGWAAASLSALPGEKVRPGVRGVTMFATSILYYGYLDFWNTAQSELWYSMFAVSAVAAAVRIEKDTRASFVSGVFAGAALIMKPPAMWIVLVAIVWLVFRTMGSGKPLERVRRLVGPLLRFGIGGAVVPVLAIGYFAMKGALPALIDIVVGANSYYVKHETGGTIYEGTPTYLWCYFPLVPFLLVYLVLFLRKESRPRFRLALGVTAGAYLAVIMQGKYYLLHWTVCVPAFAVIVANLARRMQELLERAKRPRPWIFAPAFPALIVALWLGASWTWHGPQMWWLSTKHAYDFTTGKEDREAFAWNFSAPGGGFWFWTSERVGNWLRDHTTESDYVTVRGFQPEIYAVARRRHGGRFFWTTFITNPARAYKREQWLKEDLDDIVKYRPKYVVALTQIPEGPDSVSYFEKLGYKTAHVMWEFTIMERAAP